MSAVIDAQVHVWLPESPDRPWPAGGAQWRETLHRPQRVSGSELLDEMRDAGVDRAVLVPPLFEGHRNDYAMACARDQPDRFRVMARLNLGRPDLAEAVQALADEPLMSGIRLVFLPNDAGAIADGVADRLWAPAERLDLPIMVFAPGQLRELSAVAAAHPGLRLAIDHLGLSGKLTDGAIEPEIAELLTLADVPEISVKLTSLPTYSTEPYPHPALHDLVRRVVEAFGPDRIFWGSDLSRLRGRYVDAVRLVREELGLSDDEQSAVLGGNLARWLAWNTTEPVG